MEEPVAELQKTRRLRARAREQRFIRHRSEDQVQNGSRNREDRGALENATERARELAVPCGCRRDRVDGPLEILPRERGLEDLHDIREGDPAHPLLPARERPADPRPEYRQEVHDAFDSRQRAGIQLPALGIPVEDGRRAVRRRWPPAQDRYAMPPAQEMTRQGVADESRPPRDENVQVTPRRW